MKHNLLLLFIMISLAISCSTDEIENKVGNADAITGAWHATALKVDTNTATDNAKFGKQILDFLTDKDCHILSLTFNQDLTRVFESAANYLQINATATGLEIPCPTEVDADTVTYTYDGETLTTTDASGNSASIGVTIDGDTMTINAIDLNIPNFNYEGELIFKRN